MRLSSAFAASLLVLSACATTERLADAREATGRETAVAIPPCPADASVMDGWDDRAPPRRLFGNTYYVGTCGLTSLLVTSPAGHVLIDGATAAAAPHIEANIRMLGFRPEDVKYILNSHEHSDHAGGLAQLQRATSAQVLARAPAIATLRSGKSDRGDPQFLIAKDYPPVVNVKAVADGDTVRVGGLALIAHATPGHTPGGTSWTWRSCEDTRCLNLAYTDSTSAIADKDYRYSAHPDSLAAFRKGLTTMAALPCDIQITPHPLGSNLFARLDGRADAPLVDTAACAGYAARGAKGLDERITKERAASP